MNETEVIQIKKNEIQMKIWQEQIKAQKASGQNVRTWCNENGINEKTFYYHMRKVREKILENEPAIIPLSMADTINNEIRIEKNGLSISMPTGISAETLLAVVRELC